MPLPSFVTSGKDTPKKTSRFVTFTAGEPVKLVMLTSVDPPDDDESDGRNSIIHFMQYSIWLEAKDRPEGTQSPMFPQLNGPGDPGKLLGLEPRFKALALVMDPETNEEKIWAMTKSVFDQLPEIESASGEPLRGMLLQIVRTGEKLSTRYRVTPSGKRYELDGEPETNLAEWIGPTTREEIIEMLIAVNCWPPEGGDPLA